MKVVCDVEETDLEGDDGRIIPGVVVRCTECDHEVQSYGTSQRSIRWCLAILAEECPIKGDNFYCTDEDA